MKKRAACLSRCFRFLLIAGGFSSYAQTTDSLSLQTGWIEQMSDKVAVDVSFNNAYNTFKVKTPVNTILLYPNTPNNLKLKVNYEFISFGFQFSPGFLPGNGDNATRGKTRSFQLGSAFIFRHWFADFSYARVKGFYLNNTADYLPGWKSGDPYIQFPQLYHEGVSVSSGYIRNPRFSFRSLTSQTERQVRSAGTFLPVCNLDYYVVDDRSSASSTQKSKNIEANIGPGYAYTCVIGQRFYLSLGVFTSLGYLNTTLTTRTPAGNQVSAQDNFIARWDGKTGIGYNGKVLYTGLYANVSGTTYRQQHTTAINSETRVLYHLFLGMRLTAPSFLVRQITKIKNKLP